MHDAGNTLRVFASVWLGVMGVVVVCGILTYTLGSGERREANRRSIRNSLNAGGWIWLSLTLKHIGYAFPRAEQLAWLWIPALISTLLSWSLKGLRWLGRWRKRRRPVESSYTRSLRGASRTKP